MFHGVAHSWVWLYFGFSICSLFLCKSCLLFGGSFGSLGSGSTWWWMTGCPLEMENCCLFIRPQAPSSGAPCWRRPMPSESYHCFALKPQLHSSFLFLCKSSEVKHNWVFCVCSSGSMDVMKLFLEVPPLKVLRISLEELQKCMN